VSNPCGLACTRRSRNQANERRGFMPWIRPPVRRRRSEAEYQETINKSKALLAAAEEAVRFASAAKKGQ
jgi:hypothetical protein